MQTFGFVAAADLGAVAAAVVGTILLRVRPIQETDAGVDEAIDTSIPGVDV